MFPRSYESCSGVSHGGRSSWLAVACVATYADLVGTEAAECFADAERIAGVLGKMRLASMASITSSEAEAVADDPELLNRLRQALDRLRVDLRGAANAPRQRATSPAVAIDGGEVIGLRRQLGAILELMSQRSLVLSDRESALRRVTETTSRVLEVSRVSVWLLDAKDERLHCADLFEASTRAHSSGMELHARDYPPYFTALLSERTIAAHDAEVDFRTSCFAVGYLRPLDIKSMLDVPIWAAGRNAGVLCHEQVRTPRRWGADEIDFAYIMASIVGIALERFG